MTTQNTAPVSGANPAIDLNKVHFFKPVAGKSLREQLASKKLAGPEVVEYMRSFICKNEELEELQIPEHWGKKPTGIEFIEAFSLLYQTPACRGGVERGFDIHGFAWSEIFDWRVNPYSRFVDGDVLDLIVMNHSHGHNDWGENDWVLVVEDDEPPK